MLTFVSLLDGSIALGGGRWCRCLHFNLSVIETRCCRLVFNPCEHFQSTMHRLRYGTIKKTRDNAEVKLCAIRTGDRPGKTVLSRDLTEVLSTSLTLSIPFDVFSTSSNHRPCPRGFSGRWNFPQGSFPLAGSSNFDARGSISENSALAGLLFPTEG